MWIAWRWKNLSFSTRHTRHGRRKSKCRRSRVNSKEENSETNYYSVGERFHYNEPNRHTAKTNYFECKSLSTGFLNYVLPNTHLQRVLQWAAPSSFHLMCEITVDRVFHSFIVISVCALATTVVVVVDVQCCDLLIVIWFLWVCAVLVDNRTFSINRIDTWFTVQTCPTPIHRFQLIQVLCSFLFGFFPCFSSGNFLWDARTKIRAHSHTETIDLFVFTCRTKWISSFSLSYLQSVRRCVIFGGSFMPHTHP